MGIKRIAVLLALAAALALLVSACGGGGSSSNDNGGESTASEQGSASENSGGGSEATAEDSEAGPIVIGASMGFTGVLSFYDKPLASGIEAAISAYNAKGGVDGRELELIKNDNATELNQIAPKAEEIIEKHPALLVTSSSDTTAIPADKVAQENGQLVMSATGPTTVGSELGNLVFNVWPGNPTEAGVATEFFNKKGWKKVILVEDLGLGYTKDICAKFQESFEVASPGGVVEKVTYNDANETTFPSQVTAIRSAASNADAVVICGLYTGAPTLMKQMRSAGVELPIFGFGAGLDGDFWAKSVPNLGEFYSNAIGAINPEGGSVYSNNPNKKEIALLDKIEKETGERPPTGHVYIGYSVVEMLVKAIEMTGGNTESEALAEALDEFEKVPTLVGYTTYTPECHVPKGRNLAITTIENGKGRYLETITPKEEFVPEAPC